MPRSSVAATAQHVVNALYSDGDTALPAQFSSEIMWVIIFGSKNWYYQYKVFCYAKSIAIGLIFCKNKLTL